MNSERIKKVSENGFRNLLFVRARPYFENVVFRVPKNGELKINKPPAMRVVEDALAYNKKTSNDTIYVGSPTAYRSKEVSKWT